MKSVRVFLVTALLLFVSGVVTITHAQELKEQWNESAKLIEQEKFSEAVTLLQNMLANDALPEQIRPGVLFRLAYSYSGLGNEKKAAETWKMVLELLPEEGSVWANLGWSQYLLGDIKEAIVSTEKGLAFDESMMYAWANLGLYHLDLGNKDAAMKAYNTAMEKVTGEDDIKGAVDDLEKLASKKPELKNEIDALRQRFAEAAKQAGEKTE
ncbi:MAG: tetratricopeptide repeat protein [Bacteroidia bacterium]|nr:tetratricopeptide repeat protein [Bacteroidia bacterium]